MTNLVTFKEFCSGKRPTLKQFVDYAIVKIAKGEGLTEQFMSDMMRANDMAELEHEVCEVIRKTRGDNLDFINLVMYAVRTKENESKFWGHP